MHPVGLDKLLHFHHQQGKKPDEYLEAHREKVNYIACPFLAA